ncbi:MAG: hypothetical protein R3223_04795 [Longimicrobiales bacterium]|nr:hypothetical protein [Longimicrobiales bacterium]
MAEADGSEPRYALPDDFDSNDVFITVDPGYPYCVDQPNVSVPPGAAVRWRSGSGQQFEICFPDGAPCPGWNSECETSHNGMLVCVIPPNQQGGGYKYSVKIGNCESDPIIWVQ